MVFLKYFTYRFPKKFMMLPCPGFPTGFFVFADEDGVGKGALSLLDGGGSSSEKDSHAGSSFVTKLHQCVSSHIDGEWMTHPDSPPHP